jgi:hypothetical protein
MSGTLTIRLDQDLERLLDQLCKGTGQNRSEIVREALRRQLARTPRTPLAPHWRKPTLDHVIEQMVGRCRRRIKPESVTGRDRVPNLGL